MAAMTSSTPPSTVPGEAGQRPTPIAGLDLVVLDTPEPQVLADFYCALLGWHVTDQGEDWITIRGDSAAGIAFQLAPNLVPPTWPESTVPQQFHLDLKVADLDVAERQVLAIGARATGEPQQRTSFRVFLDPSGHPFCLCLHAG